MYITEKLIHTEEQRTMNAKTFLQFVKNDALEMIYNDIDNNKVVQPITVSFYGKSIEIDAHADNFEELCKFLSAVIINDNYNVKASVCPLCSATLEQADFLEGSSGFDSAYICMNEDNCNNSKYYDQHGNEII